MNKTISTLNSVEDLGTEGVLTRTIIQFLKLIDDLNVTESTKLFNCVFCGGGGGEGSLFLAD